LFNVHIDKLSLCYERRAAKIGMIYENSIFKKNKKNDEIERFLKETQHNLLKMLTFLLKKEK